MRWPGARWPKPSSSNCATCLRNAWRGWRGCARKPSPAPATNVPASAPRPATPRKPAAASARRRWPWVALVLGVCALALVATWWWPRGQGSPAADSVLEQGVQRLQDEVEIDSEELPEQAPAARFDATTALLTHPDFELVMDAQEEALARDADFHAWYAAGARRGGRRSDARRPNRRPRTRPVQRRLPMRSSERAHGHSLPAPDARCCSQSLLVDVCRSCCPPPARRRWPKRRRCRTSARPACRR